MNTVIVIVGPTASGKTGIAVKLAKKINGEIISCDARQIYKRMDIGTNKPTKKQLEAVPHHLINIIEPLRNFNAGEFAKLSDKIIKEIHGRKKLPLIAGGTGLYAKAVIDGLIEIPSNEKIRKKIEVELKNYGKGALYEKLVKIDPETAGTIDRNNPRRIVRALEICLLTGKKFSALKKEIKKSEYKFLIFGLSSERNELYKKINRRVDKMVKNGLINEVKKLAKKYSYDNTVLKNTIGYGEILAFLNGELTKDEAVNLIKRNTRRYAKRQLTWFRKDSRIIWIDPKNNPLKNILNYLKKSDII